MKNFLSTSPIAEKVKLKSYMVVGRMECQASGLAGIGKEGYTGIPGGPFELEVNGLAIGEGMVVRKGGEYFLKIRKMYGEAGK